MSAPTTTPPAAQSAGDRFGCSLDFVRLHWGRHVCLDGRGYESRCLITNPEREQEAMGMLTSWPVTAAQPGEAAA